MKKTKIILYGKLVKLLGQKVFYAELHNVSQVFSFLQANYPQIQNTLLKTNYCIKVGNDYVNEKNINYPLSDQTLRLVPVAEGAFLGAVFGFVAKTLIPKAVKLLAVNVAAKAAQGAASTILGAATKAAQPKTQAQKSKFVSGAFNNITNTVNAGTAIPLLYGETIVGSIVVSSAVDSVQFSGKGKEKYNI